jgi:hypothetical protein
VGLGHVGVTLDDKDSTVLAHVVAPGDHLRADGRAMAVFDLCDPASESHTAIPAEAVTLSDLSIGSGTRPAHNGANGVIGMGPRTNPT